MKARLRTNVQIGVYLWEQFRLGDGGGGGGVGGVAISAEHDESRKIQGGGSN